jgi:glyceraldehyde 3-phosphate dehydrogenase
VVAESTGVFASFEKSQAHLKAGAKRVVISGPVKDSQNFELTEGQCNTALIGINDEIIEKSVITSNASCTTNAVGIPMQILQDEIGIEQALLDTVHSYTATQSIVDGPVRPGKQDFRRGRAAAQNMVPTSTGSAVALTKVIPALEGKFDGIALRVPTVVGSMVDITMILKEEKTVEEINNIFKKAQEKYSGKMRVEEEQIVSSDIVGDTSTSIIDLSFTRIQGKLLKIMV